MNVRLGDRDQLEAFTVGHFQILVDVSTGIDNHGHLGSLAADHVGSMSQCFVVKVFEQHLLISFVLQNN